MELQHVSDRLRMSKMFFKIFIQIEFDMNFSTSVSHVSLRESKLVVWWCFVDNFVVHCPQQCVRDADWKLPLQKKKYLPITDIDPFLPPDCHLKGEQRCYRMVLDTVLSNTFWIRVHVHGIVPDTGICASSVVYYCFTKNTTCQGNFFLFLLL